MWEGACDGTYTAFLFIWKLITPNLDLTFTEHQFALFYEFIFVSFLFLLGISRPRVGHLGFWFPVFWVCKFFDLHNLVLLRFWFSVCFQPPLSLSLSLSLVSGTFACFLGLRFLFISCGSGFVYTAHSSLTRTVNAFEFGQSETHHHHCHQLTNSNGIEFHLLNIKVSLLGK